VKLLFDQNISHRLVEALSDLYPGSSHVRLIGLERAEDVVVWTLARDLGSPLRPKILTFTSEAFCLGLRPRSSG
jgi:predicted nuclease of predicted toxin-antitoxin system